MLENNILNVMKTEAEADSLVASVAKLRESFRRMSPMREEKKSIRVNSKRSVRIRSPS